MSPPALGRAQLVAVLDRLPEQQWPAAAAALGFVPRPVPPVRPAPPPGPNAVPATAAAGPASTPATGPTDLPDLPFWRLAAERPLAAAGWSAAAPDWLVRTAPWERLPQTDRAFPTPRPAALAPRSRQARLLRQALAMPGAGSGLAALDLTRLCHCLAERRVPPRLPRLVRRVWPGEVRLLIDLAAPLAARRRGNRHLSPLVRLEEELTAAAYLAGPAREQARSQARALAATLYRDADPGLRQSLTAFIAGLGRRRPALLAQQPALALAWGLAHRDRLRGAAPPPLPTGLGLRHLAWLLSGDRPPRPVVLAQVGAALGVYPAPPADTDPRCPLAELAMDADYWQVEPMHLAAGGGAPGQPPAPAAEAPQVLRLRESLPLDPATRYRLTIGRRQLDLEAIRRPPWAAGLGRDAAGLFADLADGRRLYWVPHGRMAVADGPDTAAERRGGFWWDAAEYRAWLAAGRRLERPAWAVRHGVDQAGWWAEFALKGVVQRLRWIPPGEFLMGSPPDEPGRCADERQHPVILTQGYWLADTACSQALWRAVLREDPSGFTGAERPVGQVRWTEVAERFLPALNARVAGLDARLPTEAQWEHACRAGTATPFSFGRNITTDQVNYDGNRPYVGGAEGKSRGETAEVKALPANAWGLYQMHGNVWEWCADWLGEYPGDLVVDPLGPPEGRERVLRGGGWIREARSCRSACRSGFEPADRGRDFGFRLSRGPSPPAGSRARHL